MNKTKKIFIIFQIMILFLLSGGLFFMVRGHKDYGEGGETKIIHSVTDLGELAVRLESIDTFQRSGNVIWINKLDSTKNMLLENPGGTGAEVYITDALTYNHTGCLGVVGGDEETDLTAVWKNIASLESSRMGMEIKLRPTAYPDRVRFYIRYYDGEKCTYGNIDIDFSDSTLRYKDKDNNQILLDTLEDLSAEVYIYHVMKFTVDFETGKYIKLYWDNRIYDLSEYELRSFDSVTIPVIRTDLVVYGQDGNNPIVHFNDWIFTINEP